RYSLLSTAGVEWKQTARSRGNDVRLRPHVEWSRTSTLKKTSRRDPFLPSYVEDGSTYQARILMIAPEVQVFPYGVARSPAEALFFSASRSFIICWIAANL